MKRDAIHFQGALWAESGSLRRAFLFNKYYSDRNKVFKREMDKVDALETGAEKKEALIKVASNEDLMLDATSHQIMQIYRGFRELGCFDEMILLYGNVENEDFTRAPMVREMLGVAYNKVKNPEKALAVAAELYAEGLASGEVYRIMGNASLLLSDMSKDDTSKKAYLEKSASLFEEGFKKFFEFNPGIQAVHRNIELGNLEKAVQMAKLVSMACKRDGAKETSDHRCMIARLEAACIMHNKKEINKTILQIAKSDMPPWMMKDAVDSLSRVNKSFGSLETRKVIKTLQDLSEGRPTSLPKKDNSQEEAVLNAIHKNSYTYRGAGSSFGGTMTIEGNFKYGGQLPAHSISRKDLEFFDCILEQKVGDLFPPEELPENVIANMSLDQIKNPNVFLQLTDKFIRYHFGTNNFLDSGLHLEDNASTPNSLYDQCVDALIHLSGKERHLEEDSKTNISAMFALGLGDCRHHTQVKQIMFDCWQKKKMNTALSQAMDALESENPKKYDNAVEKFYNVYNCELRTLDVKVNAPLKMNEEHIPEKTKEGKLVMDPAGTTVIEEHSLSVLLQRNRRGILEKVELRDAFYQNHYPWGHLPVDLNKIEVNGKDFKMPAGFISSEQTDTGHAVSLTLTPTAYAGKRDVPSRDCTGEEVRLMGIPLRDLQTSREFITILGKRSQTKQDLMNILSYSKEAKEKAAQKANKGQKNQKRKEPIQLPAGHLSKKYTR